MSVLNVGFTFRWIFQWWEHTLEDSFPHLFRCLDYKTLKSHFVVLGYYLSWEVGDFHSLKLLLIVNVMSSCPYLSRSNLVLDRNVFPLESICPVNHRLFISCLRPHLEVSVIALCCHKHCLVCRKFKIFDGMESQNRRFQKDWIPCSCLVFHL